MASRERTHIEHHNDDTHANFEDDRRSVPTIKSFAQE